MRSFVGVGVMQRLVKLGCQWDVRMAVFFHHKLIGAAGATLINYEQRAEVGADDGLQNLDKARRRLLPRLPPAAKHGADLAK